MLAEFLELLFWSRRRIDDDIGKILVRTDNDFMQHVDRRKNRYSGFKRESIRRF